ncbi:hypothetical protein MLD38_022723 [Melastoma candidum]|uniref:Uncharacterized protein n=1 Tax=Melastoma candidum TaxID=119954 RepID=A0ACB9QN93_9MYRT|nr:hypothetical protein MLD38_022723 [Melastoma candidum]
MSPSVSRLAAATASSSSLIVRRCVSSFLRPRSYSATALQDYYYDSYSDSEDEAPGHDRGSPSSLAGSLVTERGVQWVVMGDRGAKKGLYAQRLSKLLQVPYIFMGSLVRQELEPRSSLYNQIANALNERKLVPEEVIFTLLSKRLEEGYRRGETGFILEGIPRNRIQAEILDQLADIDLVVNFKCPEEDLLRRDLGIMTITQSIESTLADKCGPGTGVSSVVDLGGHWKEKCNLYMEQNNMLEEYYQKQKKLINFQVASAPSETWRGLLAALHLQPLNAVGASKKTTPGFSAA